MTGMGIAAFVLGGISVVGVIIFLVQQYEKKRAELLQAAAESMRFTFSRKAEPGLLERLKHFHLFSQGHSKRIKNVLRGQAGELDVSVFDYSYRTGGGQHSRHWTQTVILFESDTMRLPQFALRPEHVFHKIGQVFGYRDIDFDSHPEFSKSYLLQGENEESVRWLFGDDALFFYEADRKLSTEASGGQLIHYRSDKRVKPEAIQAFITEGVRVLTLFRK